MLLTQKTGVPPPPGDFSDKDLYTKQWRQVQTLANQFWTRWSCEYLPCLQHKQKWTVPHRNLQVGDLVLGQAGSVLSFKEFNLQIFPLNIFWYIFSSDIVKFIITFPLSNSFVKKKNIYISFVSCDDITSCLVTSC